MNENIENNNKSKRMLHFAHNNLNNFFEEKKNRISDEMLQLMGHNHNHKSQRNSN